MTSFYNGVIECASLILEQLSQKVKNVEAGRKDFLPPALRRRIVTAELFDRFRNAKDNLARATGRTP